MVYALIRSEVCVLGIFPHMQSLEDYFKDIPLALHWGLKTEPLLVNLPLVIHEALVDGKRMFSFYNLGSQPPLKAGIEYTVNSYWHSEIPGNDEMGKLSHVYFP